MPAARPDHACADIPNADNAETLLFFADAAGELAGQLFGAICRFPI